jgi:tagaturonate epimerase
MKIEKYTIGIGDRFGKEGVAQLSAISTAASRGIDIVPVWNKSNREHTIIGSEPGDVRREADAAVKDLGWAGAYHVDADHIGLKTVDRFIEASDFYTIDVADFTGHAAPDGDIEAFRVRHGALTGSLSIPGLAEPITITSDDLSAAARKFLLAMQEAGKIYRHVASKKGAGSFVAEVSVDETDTPQSPAELLLILRMIADEGIPAQTIAPKFTGRFNKGVDYVGDVVQFEKEFREDIATIAYAVATYGLPANLKLSVHSGSDKFSIYEPIRKALKDTGAGVHVKTAGTTWLEELIGLAEAGGDALALAKEIYAGAYDHAEELCAPYATVIDIRTDNLPTPETVNGWTSEQYVRALRHIESDPQYNPDFRQLLHVGFKIAAKMGARYLQALEANEDVIAKNVTANFFDRHITPLFLAQ